MHKIRSHISSEFKARYESVFNTVTDILIFQDSERPAIFVCHSLGGIITKKSLRLSRAARYQPRLQSLYEQTYVVIFLGTPHRESTYAPWRALMGNLAKLALQSPNTSLLRSLEVNSTMIRGDIAVYSFREERGMSGIYGLHHKVTHHGVLFGNQNTIN